LEVVAVHPVVAAVGAGEPHGKANTCHDVAAPAFVHPIETELKVKAVVVKAIGCEQLGGGPHVIFDAQPAAVVVAFDVNTNVKQPLAALEVNEGGNVVPEKVPKTAPALLFPLYTVKISKPA
jgi:hypothetical protein